MDLLGCDDVMGGSPSGSAGVPPAQLWHSFTPLLHPTRPATAPRFCFSRAQAVPAGGVAGRRIAGNLSGTLRECMRARRPRSRRVPLPWVLVDRSFFRLFQAAPTPCRADHTRVKQPLVNNGEPRMNTNRHEDPWASLAATTSWEEALPGARASRPHNTGTASPVSSTRLDRQRRQDSASAEPTPFRAAGSPGAISQGNRAARNGSACGRDARAPGGRLSRGSWWIPLFSVCFRQALFLRGQLVSLACRSEASPR